MTPSSVALDAANRGRLKQALVEARWPADDQAAVSPGMPFELRLRDELVLRPYQHQAVESWLPSGTGVIVLPCGAGKTVTAIAAAAEVGANTLVLGIFMSPVDAGYYRLAMMWASAVGLIIPFSSEILFSFYSEKHEAKKHNQIDGIFKYSFRFGMMLVKRSPGPRMM